MIKKTINYFRFHKTIERIQKDNYPNYLFLSDVNIEFYSEKFPISSHFKGVKCRKAILILIS
ncbi:hypothetical protein BpHYR1_015697 [Brachionus plicatilis]|uniref:Uncharacterized protein n=1 Tax=Brachionus plicatilis TaxID=10195 RepID=A0A3M7RGH3_BRAPC|nr:hypothetical protein BpHYR1_015697 [Brachionus plicatilis]